MSDLDFIESPSSVKQLSRQNDREYQRLGALYEISKALTTFESVEKSFPEILNLVSATFSIHSVVLVEDRGGTACTTIWPLTGLTENQIARIVSKARYMFSYLTDSSSSQSSGLQSSDIILGNLGKHPSLKFYQPAKEKNLLAFPLVVDQDRIFGILQFEGVETSNEDDLKFANALVNLIAVAFDRQYRIQQEGISLRTERDKLIEFATELEEERGLREKFVQMLSHDLKNPLSAIGMAAHLLAGSKILLSEQMDLVKLLMKNVQRLNQMIESLLDASRLKAGEKLPLVITECNLGALTEDVVMDLKEITNENIVFDCPKPVTGQWDCGAMQRIAENLIGNAIKYKKEKTAIRVSLKNTGEGALLSVHNEGTPIAPEDQKTLFDQFRRTKSAELGGKVGWGLGLTLVKGLCAAHGGKVWLESAEGKGTTFFVQLPYSFISSKAKIG